MDSGCRGQANSMTNDHTGMSARQKVVAPFLRFIAVVYALLGFLFLWVATPYIIGLLRLGVSGGLSRRDFMFWTFLYFNIVGGAVIAYALWTLRPWGRYVALLFNAVYIVLIVSRFIERGFHWSYLLSGLLAVWIAFFLLTSDVKKAMQNRGA